MGGTSRQRNLKKITYGMYSSGRISLFALPEGMLVQHWRSMPKPSLVKEYTKFGATVIPAGKGGATLQFDESSLRLFYLYDVLLHEVGHHVDRSRESNDAERYAHWFAEFQHARLLAPLDSGARPSPNAGYVGDPVPLTPFSFRACLSASILAMILKYSSWNARHFGQR